MRLHTTIVYILKAFKKKFQGRAGRIIFIWSALLFAVFPYAHASFFLLLGGLDGIYGLTVSFRYVVGLIIISFPLLLLFLPFYSKQLRNVGKSGWSALLVLIPFVNAFFVVSFLFRFDSKTGDMIRKKGLTAFIILHILMLFSGIAVDLMYTFYPSLLYNAVFNRPQSHFAVPEKIAGRLEHRDAYERGRQRHSTIRIETRKNAPVSIFLFMDSGDGCNSERISDIHFRVQQEHTILYVTIEGYTYREPLKLYGRGCASASLVWRTEKQIPITKPHTIDTVVFILNGKENTYTLVRKEDGKYQLQPDTVYNVFIEHDL